MKVLVWAAHPDDELLGVGGTIARHIKAGDTVTIALWDKCRQQDWSKPEAVARYLGAHFTHTEPEPADIIYTHHTGDLNEHHRIVAERALVLGRFARTIRTFETVSSTEWGLAPFAPDFYVSIDLTEKMELLERFYEDELRDFPHPRSLSGIETLALLRGSTVGLRAAEAFKTIRHTWP